MGALKDNGADVVGYEQTDNSLIEQSRSMLATQALDEGADVLFWADDDVVFHPADAVTLVGDAEHYGSLVCAPVAVRGGCAVNTTFVDGVRVQFFEKGHIYEMLSSGLACAALHTNVLRDVAKRLPRVQVWEGAPPCYPFFRGIIEHREGHEHPRWMGEDTAFCLRARAVGYRLWCNTRVRTTHWTPKGYRIEDVIVGASPDQAAPEATFPSNPATHVEWKEEYGQ